MKFINRIFDIKFDKSFRASLDKKINKVLDKGFLSNHDFCRLLEKRYSFLNNSKFGLAVSNGTSALEVLLKSINVKNKKVLIGTNTFIATAVAVENCGGIPVPIDIESQFWGLCPENLKKSISKDIGAVIVIHIGGIITPLIQEIKSICDSKKVPLIEDCSQAHFSSFKNTNAGNFGYGGTFSFYTTKNITCGEGGLVVTNNIKTYIKIKSLRQFGVTLKNKDDHKYLGSNYKMSELNACFALCDIERFRIRFKRREMIAKRYQYNLKNSPWKCIEPIEGKSSYYKQIIISPIKRKNLLKNLLKKKIQLTGGVYNIPLHNQSRYKNIFNLKNFKNSNFFSNYHICPPCYPEMNFKQVDYICEKFLEIIN